MKNVPGEKMVSVSGMSVVDGKVEEMYEKRDGRHHCLACDYSSDRMSNIKEHMEIHIEGLSYCKLCDKSFRSKPSLRTHLNNLHR